MATNFLVPGFLLKTSVTTVLFIKNYYLKLDTTLVSSFTSCLPVSIWLLIPQGVCRARKKAWNSICKIPGLEMPGKKKEIMDKGSGKAWNFLHPGKKGNS